MILDTSLNLFVSDVKGAIRLYSKLFHAHHIELFIDELNDNNIGATFKIADSLFFLALESDKNKSPLNISNPVCIQLMLDDIQLYIKKAKYYDCEILFDTVDVKDRFKVCNIKDPYGYVWCLTQK